MSDIVQNCAGIIEIKNKMIIVFYDGKCGLCSREIRHYINIAPVDIFDWQDITISRDCLKKYGISHSNALKLLHAIGENGKVHVGLKAFIFDLEAFTQMELSS